MRLKREDIVMAYRALLGREPEGEAAIDGHRHGANNIEELLLNIVDSQEYRARAKTGPAKFYHFHSNLDLEKIIRRYEAADIAPHPDCYTNFLGVRVPVKVLDWLKDKSGQVEPIPIPANWHADMAEWGAVLRGVDLARELFTIVELGCGWGCWLNNAGTAARRAGLRVRLIGVEGDDGYLAFAREALSINGFVPEEITLHRGIAAGRDGIALFPRQQKAGENWGLEPVFGADKATREKAVAAGTHDELPMIALPSLLDASMNRVDLLHVDIQGGGGRPRASINRLSQSSRGLYGHRHPLARD